MKRVLTLAILFAFFFSTTSFAESIEMASHQQIDFIKQGFFEPVTVLKSAAAIRGDSQYYVGLNFVAKGYKRPGIGIWLMEGGKHNPSRAYTVNATAILFSGFLNANQAQLAASMSDPEAKRILNYFKKE